MTSQPNAGDWAAVRSLFESAQGLAPEQRAAQVQTQAQALGRPDLVPEVLDLLAQGEITGADETGDFLQPLIASGSLAGHMGAHSPSPEVTQVLEHPTGTAAPLPAGQRLGAWEVLGRLGDGGMAEVWSARRADGAWQGEAAIKVLKHGMDSAAVLARFALEQQALARLAHPHIARLLDAGRTPAGLPYFVMEKVVGRPIDQACQGLSVAQRLALFLQLADAVACAHRHLLVHRDLKPSNVMVDEQGQVKLLDFGIAKALDPLEPGAEGPLAGTDPSALTLAGGLSPLTPRYASPEQVRGDAIGTSTDVYSLGVLLYQMLTGLRPYGRNARTPQQAMHAVLEEEPTRPSALAPALVSDPQWPATRKRLRGDLDNIVPKALEKVPEQRYFSVEALARDISAHLAHEPISVRAPSWAYRSAKFVLRNRAASLASALALLALLAGAGLALWQARVAQAERDLAQQRFAQVRQLANRLVFKYHDQIEMLPGATQVREALLQDAAEFLDGLHQDAETDPGLAQELADTYYRISRLQGVDTSINTGRHEQAEINLDKALALTGVYAHSPSAPVPAVAGVLSMMVSKAELWQRRGQVKQAEQTIQQQALPLLSALLRRAPQDSWALTSAINLHGVHARLLGSQDAASLGDWRGACGAADQARAAAQTMLAADPANRYGPDSLAFAVGEQAQCQLLAGQWTWAETLFREQLALRDTMAGRFPDDMDFRYQRAVARANLARALAGQGRLGAARQQLDEAMRMLREAMQMDPGNQAGQKRLNAMRLISVGLHLEEGQLPAAQREALEQLQAVPGAGAGSFVELRGRVEALLGAARAWRNRQPQQALAWAAQASRLLQALPGNEDNLSHHWLLAQALGEQAHGLALLGQREPASEHARQALALWNSPQAPDGPPPSQQRRIQALQALLRP